MERLKRLIGRLIDDDRILKVTNSERAKVFGSPEWLVAREAHYGGYATNVPRNTISRNDPRPRDSLFRRGMDGGDRMYRHGYAPIYHAFLQKFLLPDTDPRTLTLVETGILKGSGLAIWSDLFPGATVIGMDIDLQNFENNRDALKRKGAFSHCAPELLKFDQFTIDQEVFSRASGERGIDILIDDGYHSHETITNTFLSARQFLNDRFVFFIEDCRTGFDCIKPLIDSDMNVLGFGAMTVVYRTGK